MDRRKVIILSIIIIIFMAEPVWGNLQKALDNSKTIDEAITDAIADHEADADAHTGTGESLETHKTQDTIDHPGGSLLADKISMTEEVHESSFESIDGWGTSGSVWLENWADCRVEVNMSATPSVLRSILDITTDWINYDYNLLFQTILRYTDDHEATATFGVVYSFGDPLDQSGFGFRIVDSVLKGFWVYNDIAHYTDAIDIDFDGYFHVYRAYYEASTQEVRFYIDGELIATIEGPPPAGTFGASVVFRIEGDASSTNTLMIRKVIISRGYANI